MICQDETIAQRQIIISSIVAMSRGLTPRFPMIMTEKEIEQRAEAADLRLADAFRQRRLRGWPRRTPALAHMASKVQLAIISAAVIGGVASFRAVAQTAQSERQLNTVREIRASVRACWIAPTIRTAPQITVRLSLKQNGEILGRPLISYAGSGRFAGRARGARGCGYRGAEALHAAADQRRPRRHHRGASDQCEIGRGMEAQRRADRGSRKIAPIWPFRERRARLERRYARFGPVNSADRARQWGDRSCAGRV